MHCTFCKTKNVRNKCTFCKAKNVRKSKVWFVHWPKIFFLSTSIEFYSSSECTALTLQNVQNFYKKYFWSIIIILSVNVPFGRSYCHHRYSHGFGDQHNFNTFNPLIQSLSCLPCDINFVIWHDIRKQCVGNYDTVMQ